MSVGLHLEQKHSLKSWMMGISGGNMGKRWSRTALIPGIYISFIYILFPCNYLVYMEVLMMIDINEFAKLK